MEAVFTLKRSDGAFKNVYFEAEPEQLLIKATTQQQGTITPKITDHDRFDLNTRAKISWKKRMWTHLNSEMSKFSQGCSVKAYYINPYVAIGGYEP